MENVAPRFKVGEVVSFRDENNGAVRGRVYSWCGANDGTGRYGYAVETEPGTLYWRPENELRVMGVGWGVGV